MSAYLLVDMTADQIQWMVRDVWAISTRKARIRRSALWCINAHGSSLPNALLKWGGGAPLLLPFPLPYPWLWDVDGSTTCTVVFGTLGRGHKMSFCSSLTNCLMLSYKYHCRCPLIPCAGTGTGAVAGTGTVAGTGAVSVAGSGTGAVVGKTLSVCVRTNVFSGDSGVSRTNTFPAWWASNLKCWYPLIPGSGLWKGRRWACQSPTGT